MASQATDQALRAAILQAALDVFQSQGYAELTLDEVARRANVALGAVEAQYPDRDSLFAALVAANSPTDDLEAAFDSIEGQTAEEILRDAMRRLIGVISDNQVF